LFYDSPVAAIALAPDGRKVITGTRAGRLHVWDVDSGRGFDLPPQGAGVTSLAVSADGQFFASGTESGVIRVWDATMLGQVGQTIKFSGTVGSLALDSGGKTLAMGGDDGMIRIFEVSREQALGPPLRMDDPVQTVTFAEDGQRLLVGSAAGAHWWDLTNRKAPEPVLPGRRDRPSGPGRDRSSRSLDAALNRAEAMAVSPDGQTVAIARRVEDAEGRVRGRAELWDVATGAFLRETPEQPHGSTGVAYSPDSKWLLTWGPEPGTAWLRDVATLRSGRPLCQSSEFTIHQAVFSGDGRALLLGCRDNQARLWDLERDVEIESKLHPRHAYPVTAVAFDPNRARVVTGCHAGTVRLWDATEGKLLTELRDNAGEIVVLVFSRDGKTILTASRDGMARFLEAESGRQLGPSLHHADAVLCAAFHPDGQSVVTGTKDGMVQRWRVPPPPKTGRADEIRRWVQEQTGLQLDDQGMVGQTSGKR
jgi:WD40 repeat protein